jgi:hypothetical protein
MIPYYMQAHNTSLIQKVYSNRLFRCANFFQRGEPMNWTPYMEECLCILEETKKQPTDLLLVHLIRLQLICDQIAAVNCNPGQRGIKAPHDFYIKTFQAQMEEFKHSIPPELQFNREYQPYKR